MIGVEMDDEIKFLETLKQGWRALTGVLYSESFKDLKSQHVEVAAKQYQNHLSEQSVATFTSILTKDQNLSDLNKVPARIMSEYYFKMLQDSLQQAKEKLPEDLKKSTFGVLKDYFEFKNKKYIDALKQAVTKNDIFSALYNLDIIVGKVLPISSTEELSLTNKLARQILYDIADLGENSDISDLLIMKLLVSLGFTVERCTFDTKSTEAEKIEEDSIYQKLKLRYKGGGFSNERFFKVVVTNAIKNYEEAKNLLSDAEKNRSDCLSHYIRQDSRLSLWILIKSKWCGDINAKNSTGDTALHVACFVENAKIIEYLLNQGSDLKIKNNEGKTPLDLANERLKSNRYANNDVNLTRIIELLEQGSNKKATLAIPASCVQSPQVESKSALAIKQQ